VAENCIVNVQTTYTINLPTPLKEAELSNLEKVKKYNTGLLDVIRELNLRSFMDFTTTSSELSNTNSNIANVNSSLSNLSNNAVLITGNQSVNGVKTFLAIPECNNANIPANASQLVRRDAVVSMSTRRIAHTWAIPGEILVPSNEINYIVPFFVSIPANHFARIVGVRYVIHYGNSVTCSLQQNGNNLANYSNLSVNTTATSNYSNANLANEDMLSLVVSAVANNPKNFTFAVFIDTGYV
jgi:hypothetical protein